MDRNPLRWRVWRRVRIPDWLMAIVAVAVMVMPLPVLPFPIGAFVYTFVIESMYGMSDETRCAVNHIGEEINVLRAQNRDLGMVDTAETAAHIEANDKRILGLLGDLDRLPAEDVSVGRSNMTCPHTVDAQAVDDHAYVVGNREILVGRALCTSGVVVERTTAGGVAETGVLTNEHCGDAGDPVAFRWMYEISAERSGGVFYGCDCAFVKLEYEYVIPDTVWTKWGPIAIPEYRDFEVGEWVEFHGRGGYSLGRVLAVMDVWGANVYVIDVETVKGDSGGPFIALRDGSFGGMNSAGDGLGWGAPFGFSWQTVQQTLGVERP